MAQKRVNDAVREIAHDPRAVERGLAARDSKYVPFMFAALFVCAVGALAFAFAAAVRTYQHVAAYHTCAIVYSVVVGLAAAAYTAADLLYTGGFIGLRDKDMPPELLRVMRRYCTDSYIRPRVFYDDRVVRNVIGVWALRLLVPGLYALVLVAFWGVADDRAAPPDTPAGTRFVMANVLIAALCLLHVRVIVSNVYSLSRKWDYVPAALDTPVRAPAYKRK